MKPNKIKGWEKEFDKKFDYLGELAEYLKELTKRIEFLERIVQEISTKNKQL